MENDIGHMTSSGFLAGESSVREIHLTASQTWFSIRRELVELPTLIRECFGAC